MGWGLSLNAYRKDGTRSTEEIDIVGTTRGVVSVVEEAWWRNSRMDLGYLNDLDEYKIPSLRQAGTRMTKDTDLMLFSRGTTSKLDLARFDIRAQKIVYRSVIYRTVD